MQSPNPLAPPSAERDGCGCPPWVLRCAHWEGRILVLADKRISRSLHVCGMTFAGEEDFSVANRKPEHWHPALCGCPLIHGYAIGTPFPNLPAAEAEFERRQLVLLGREPSP